MSKNYKFLCCSLKDGVEVPVSITETQFKCNSGQGNLTVFNYTQYTCNKSSVCPNGFSCKYSVRSAEYGNNIKFNPKFA